MTHLQSEEEQKKQHRRDILKAVARVIALNRHEQV